MRETLDFGNNLQVHEKRTFTFGLKNSGSFNFDFLWVVCDAKGKKVGLKSVMPPYVTVSTPQGVAPKEGEVEIVVDYHPLDGHTLDGHMLKMLIPSARGAKSSDGQLDAGSYVLDLSGKAMRPSVDFSFTNYDFGYCFINKKATATVAGFDQQGPGQGSGSRKNAFKRVDLVVKNNDKANDCLLATTFQRTAFLDVQLNQSMIEAGGELIVPIYFMPNEAVEYRERIEFIVNDFTKFYVSIRGKGTPLRLELANIAMQTVDFGVTIGGKPPVNRHLKIVNRSLCDAEFLLVDGGERLKDRSVYWESPAAIARRKAAEEEVKK